MSTVSAWSSNLRVSCGEGTAIVRMQELNHLFYHGNQRHRLVAVQARQRRIERGQASRVGKHRRERPPSHLRVQCLWKAGYESPKELHSTAFKGYYIPERAGFVYGCPPYFPALGVWGYEVGGPAMVTSGPGSARSRTSGRHMLCNSLSGSVTVSGVRPCQLSLRIAGCVFQRDTVTVGRALRYGSDFPSRSVSDQRSRPNHPCVRIASATQTPVPIKPVVG